MSESESEASAEEESKKPPVAGKKKKKDKLAPASKHPSWNPK